MLAGSRLLYYGILLYYGRVPLYISCTVEWMQETGNPSTEDRQPGTLLVLDVRMDMCIQSRAQALSSSGCHDPTTRTENTAGPALSSTAWQDPNSTPKVQHLLVLGRSHHQHSSKSLASPLELVTV